MRARLPLRAACALLLGAVAVLAHAATPPAAPASPPPVEQAPALPTAAAAAQPAPSAVADVPAPVPGATAAPIAAPAAPQPAAVIATPTPVAVPAPRPLPRTVRPMTDQAPSTASAVGSTVFALILIVALIFGLSYIAKRMPGVGVQAGGALRVVAALALSPKERVVVVDVGGQQLLLSTGAAGTRLLQTLDTPLPAAPAAQPFKPFAQVLAQQFGRKP